MRVTRAEVNLTNIEYNLKQIQERVGHSTKVMAVVKANAYGHGMVQVAKSALKAGAAYLGVALVEEAIELRKYVNAPVLAFSPPVEDNIESFVRFDIDATITSMETAYLLNGVARSAHKKARVQVKVDTGMGRIGFFPKEALEAVQLILRLDSLQLVGVFSHFATSDERNKEFARRQLLTFRKLREEMFGIGDMSNVMFHIANSGAILDMKDSYFDMVRPGIMMYGYYPSHETSQSVPIRIPLRLVSEVVLIKNFPLQASISYGRRYFTPHKNTRIGVIPIGYGDGYSRLLSGKASVLIRGKRYPVVGTITMDHIMVDLGTDYSVQTGDEVTLIGEDGEEKITAWDIADALGTIPYEVLCNLNSRVPRLYPGDISTTND
ncbi:MAG: alanine racemase [Candidatus Kryptoniota bacterium]